MLARFAAPQDITPPGRPERDLPELPGAAIYIPSIGQSGGCNPISVKSRVEGGEVIVDLSALGDAASKIHS